MYLHTHLSLSVYECLCDCRWHAVCVSLYTCVSTHLCICVHLSRWRGSLHLCPLYLWLCLPAGAVIGTLSCQPGSSPAQIHVTSMPTWTEWQPRRVGSNKRETRALPASSCAQGRGPWRAGVWRVWKAVSASSISNTQGLGQLVKSQKPDLGHIDDIFSERQNISHRQRGQKKTRVELQPSNDPLGLPFRGVS